MEKIIEVQNFSVCDDHHSEAVRLHNEIITNGTMAAQALYELCRCLKRMRDEKLFTELGYNDFDTYCEEKANIKKRQAYNYIKAYEDLGEKFIADNASLGITKIELLTHVPPIERDDFLENNDVADMSVSKLKKRIEELEREYGAKCEQISLLESQVQEDKSYPDDSKKIAELTAEVEKLREERKKSVTPAELKMFEKKKKAEIKAVTEKAVREAIDKERKASAADFEAKYSEKVQGYLDKISSYEKRLAEKDASISEAIRRQADLEDKLRNAGKDNSAKFRIYFDQLNDVLEKLFEALDTVDDIGQKKKFADCLAQLGRSIIEQAQEE